MLRVILFRLSLCLAVVVALGVFHEPILTKLASFLLAQPSDSLNDFTHVTLTECDGVYETAHSLLQSKPGARVLVLKRPPRRSVQCGAQPAQEDQFISELVELGITQKQFDVQVQRRSDNPDQSQLSLWLREDPDAKLLVLVNSFNSRASEMGLRKGMDHDLKQRVIVVPVDDRRYNAGNWWRHRQGLKSFFKGAVALAYQALLAERSEEVTMSPQQYEDYFLQTLSVTTDVEPPKPVEPNPSQRPRNRKPSEPSDLGRSV